jgi:hypothetical protein
MAAVAADVPDLLLPDGRATIVEDTARGLFGIFTLGHQLGYFSILPLYIALMLWAPLPLLLARLHPRLSLGAALAR